MKVYRIQSKEKNFTQAPSGQGEYQQTKEQIALAKQISTVNMICSAYGDAISQDAVSIAMIMHGLSHKCFVKEVSGV